MSTTESSVPLSVVFSFWKDFDLDGLRSTLDEKGLAIAATQDQSLKSRKQLAESTKEFKKSVGSDVFRIVSPLLKKYQEEVDALTQRSKLAESAFLDVFARLQEAPDPGPSLGASLDNVSRIAELESYSAKVAAELAEYKQESKELKNQDLTIRKLEERVRDLQNELEDKDSEIEAAKASAAAELEARSADETRAREERLEGELSRAQEALEAMKRLHASTQAQLLTVQERGEEAAAAARSESELAMAEVERAEQRLAELSRERDFLLEKMEQPRESPLESTGGKSIEGGDAEVQSLREELKSQRQIALRLGEELDVISNKHAKEKDLLEAKISGLQNSLSAKEVHASALEAQLLGRPKQEDLQEARRQIRMLKAILQNSAADEDEVQTQDMEKESEKLSISSMESALLEKNQLLESKLTLLRMQLSEAQESQEAIEYRIQVMEEEKERDSQLIAKLEEHLEKATRLTMYSGGEEPFPADGLSRTTSIGPVTAEDNRTMITALSAQRDRLKLKVSQLESEISSLKIELDRARDAAQSAKADNLTLVERLKFVEGYIGRGMRPPASDVENGGKAVEKYMKEYEDHMNPFTDFRAREKEARRRKLPIHDRAAYAVGSAFISGNKMARSAIIVYALALHFIAFVVLAGFWHRNSAKMDALEDLCMEYGTKHGHTVDPVAGGSIA